VVKPAAPPSVNIAIALASAVLEADLPALLKTVA